MTSMRTGSAVVIALLTLTSACDSDRNEPSATSSATAAPSTTAVAAPPVVRPYCQTPPPAAWQDAIDASEVNTGGVSTVPGDVGPAGEVAAVRDNGDTRDLLLINVDGSIDEIYPVPEPNRNNIGFVAMDKRWMVVGVDRIPRTSNGVLPTLIRVDVLDRQGGPARTVVQRSDEDYASGGPTIDSVALFGDKVYWITHDAYASSNGTLTSFDPATGAVVDLEKGNMGALRSSAVGLTFVADGGRSYSNDQMWERSEVKVPASLPTPVTDALGDGPDRLSLATDGTAYAWLTGLGQGTTGVAWWSPESGLVRVTGDVVGKSDWLPPVHVVGPYVIIDRGRQDTDTRATVVDTRSGAVTYLNDRVTDADGGTIAFDLGPGKLMRVPGVLRSEKLEPQTCP
ncbi:MULTISPECIES: hypothetical protein [unclassified Mycobacterium]|uniref:hypothetical protein n=1 Tax=unclassified Mycobacterium TaxID=2642494 RepID=UPI0029C94739|nr:MULTISPECIES: hypothetical protein [unclassified Mycobacterium]